MDHSVKTVARLVMRLGAGCLIVWNASQAGAASLSPHRAVYDLELAESSQKARLDGADGRLAFELSGSACEGWNTTFRIVNQYRYRDGSVRLADIQSVTWESGDGKELNFSQKEFIDNKLGEEKRLNVKRREPNGPGEGAIELPDQKTFNVPAEALFPMGHQAKLVDAALRGETSDKTFLFNGSDDDKTFQVISVIGKKADGGAGAKEAAMAGLNGVAHWPVSMGYFDTDKPQTEVPDFEMRFDMYENGVVSNILLDYGEVALRGRLASLELLKTEPCN
jgi:EipB-like